MPDFLQRELDRQADFARSFSGTTNLAQRRRYQEQIAAADAYRDTADEQAYEQALGRAKLKNPVQYERLQFDRLKDRRMAEQFDRRLQSEEERAAIRAANEDRNYMLRQRQADIAEKRALREKIAADRLQAHTDAVEEELTALNNEGFFEGSPEYATGVVRALSRNPYVNPQWRNMLLKGANVAISGEEILADREKFKNPVLTLHRGADGQMSYTYREATTPETDPNKEKARLIMEHERLLKLRDPASDEMRPVWDAALKENSDQLKKLYSTTAPAAPKFEVGKVYKDAKGNTAIYQADGSWLSK